MAMDAETPLLDDVVHDSVDFKGRNVTRSGSGSGSWKSAFFIICVKVDERFAYYGICLNLISYLTGPLGQSTATAAENVNAWSGTASLLPLLGAFLADSFLGRYRTIIIASGLYILGADVAQGITNSAAQTPSVQDHSVLYSFREMQRRQFEFIKKRVLLLEKILNAKYFALGLLSLSAVVYSFESSDCQIAVNNTACSPPRFQIIFFFFFFSLYLFAQAQGGHKPCLQAFGADQFDEQDPKECKDKSSFFNWWYFSMNSGIIFALCVLNYIQENVSWDLGFGIPCIVMCLALIIFLLGTMTYRFCIQSDERNPFVRIGQVFLNAARNWWTTPAAKSKEEEAQGILPYQGSEQFKFHKKALVAPDGSKEDRKVCTITEIEEAKAVLRLVPIWTTCLGYATVFSQSSTLFTKQGVTMDRSITAMTKKPSGITLLQRIGTGILLSFLSMVIAALVERECQKTAGEYGLVDLPKATVPMSVWWLIPLSI
ncbi:Protein NRT1/PTR FAMILY 5.10 [Abeliophyllum distichum]|uniref:Protein NRT1/PTR FAMILY 5.10 n=1 Tax=Abeliophyllum distichum TaxID=126358 RepID=A0ABD1S9F7_9LAMI